MSPLLGMVAWERIPMMLMLEHLKMNNIFMKSLVFLLHMPENNKDFFHRCNHPFSKCRHDYEHYEI